MRTLATVAAAVRTYLLISAAIYGTGALAIARYGGSDRITPGAAHTLAVLAGLGIVLSLVAIACNVVAARRDELDFDFNPLERRRR